MIGKLFNRILEHEILLVIEKNTGEYRITKNAMADIINKSIAVFSGLKSYKWEMKQVKNEVEVTIACQFNEDATDKDIADSIQKKLKKDIEQWVGIKIKEVKILI